MQSHTDDRYANLTGISSTQCGSPTISMTVNAAIVQFAKAIMADSPLTFLPGVTHGSNAPN